MKRLRCVGDIGAMFRELGWKTAIFLRRAVWNEGAALVQTRTAMRTAAAQARTWPRPSRTCWPCRRRRYPMAPAAPVTFVRAMRC
jgi:hypothetical protein